MDEDLELKFVCKLCHKKYPNGKSLGGHVRSHSIANSAALEEKVEPNTNKMSSLNNTGRVLELEGQSGYGLRENPKKTRRFMDSTFPVSLEVCKQCGKGFQSLKALCGHMACHSEKDRLLKDDQSWTSEKQKLVMDSHSDTEAEDLKQQHGFKSQMYKRIVTKASSFSFANGSSSVSGVDEQEEEEVAMCLMMLSRDSGSRGGVNSVVESSDNNSVVLETRSSSIDMWMSRKEGLNYVNNDGTLGMKKLGNVMLKSSVLDAEIAELYNSDSGYFLTGAQKGESDVSVDGFLGNGQYRKSKGTGGARLQEFDSESWRGLDKPKCYEIEEKNHFKKENKYDYVVIGTKSQPRKRKNGFYYSELGEESCKKVANGLSSADECKGTNKRGKYECLNCKRTFKSYQALGGHRPCHKRIGDCSTPKYEDSQNRIGHDIARDHVGSSKFEDSLAIKKTAPKQLSSNAEKRVRISTKKNKGHECPICYRTFKSGQALGGHKRSHFIVGPEDSNNQTPHFKQEVPNLLDLNLSAPELNEEDEDAKFI